MRHQHGGRPSCPLMMLPRWQHDPNRKEHQMSLNWNIEEVADSDDTCWIKATVDQPMSGIKAGDTIMNPVTNALIWHSLNTGIGKITADNAPVVFARISLVEKLFGPSLRMPDGPRPITIEDVLAHVGLSTNVFPEETEAKFLKRHAGAYLQETAAHAERERTAA